VSRFDQRQGFLMSAIVHLMIMMALINRATGGGPKPAVPAASPLPVRERIFLPSKEILRQLAPPPARPNRPAPIPTPAPAQPRTKDRISVGPPSTERAKVLELRRDDDLTQTPKGKPDAVPSAPAPPAPEIAAVSPPPVAGAGPGVRPSESQPSLAESLRNLEQRLGDVGPRGIESGTGQQMGPLFFDPQGADFTSWINQFKNEVYRNWIVPQAALLGFRGHVDLEFSVERDGTLANLRML